MVKLHCWLYLHRHLRWVLECAWGTGYHRVAGLTFMTTKVKYILTTVQYSYYISTVYSLFFPARHYFLSCPQSSSVFPILILRRWPCFWFPWEIISNAKRPSEVLTPVPISPTSLCPVTVNELRVLLSKASLPTGAQVTIYLFLLQDTTPQLIVPSVSYILHLFFWVVSLVYTHFVISYL